MSARDTCPACGATLPVTARYCSRCGVDLAEPGLVDGTGADAGGADGDDGAGDAGDESGGASGSGNEDGEGKRRGSWPLDPDGFADDSLTLLVAVGVAGVVGLVNGATALLTVYEGWALLVAPTTMLVAAGYLARRRTAGRALAHGLYALAATALLVPLVAFSPGWEGGDPGGQLVLFGLGGLVFGAAGVLLAAAGYLVERWTVGGDTAPGRVLARLRASVARLRASLERRRG